MSSYNQALSSSDEWLQQVLFVDAPWIFQPGWEVVKPWLKKYSALVRFVKRDQLLLEYFTPETAPAHFKR